ncbi:MAG: NYN domain-containing protein, partial [Actinomycetota bacterium]
RTAQRQQAGRVRDTVSAAVRGASDEIEELRRQLKARSAEVRAAERALQQAQAVANEAIQQAASAGSSRDAEIRRTRARIAELEKAAESGRRAARTTRDVDDVRLWLLVDTVTEAAASIRRELSLPIPALRLGDTVAATAAEVSRRFADDPAALDRLLALPNVHLVVDGYNVTKTGYGELALADQRSRLISSLAALRGRSRVEMTVAFDGGERPPALPPVPRGVRVLFSAADESADDLIRRLVDAEPPGRPVIVITADQQVQRDVQRAGAWAVPSVVLLARLAQP